MRVLVTGGTGFIGSRLATACLDAGESVRILAQTNNPVEAETAEDLQRRGCEMFLASVTDAEAVRRAAAGVDVVYHIAAAQHEAGRPDEHFRSINVDGTRHVLEACVEAGVKRLVHVSTIGVYQADNGAVVTDDTPTVPDNIYGVTKLEAERLVDTYRDRLSIVTIRPSEVYGPGDRRLLKLFKGIATGKFAHIGRCENLHHLVYVYDLVSALRQAAAVVDAPDQPCVIAGRESVTTHRMVESIAGALGVASPHATMPLRPFWVAATVLEWCCRPLGVTPPLHRRRMHFFIKSFNFTCRIARDRLGYEPMIGLDEGMRLTASWYREAGLLGPASGGVEAPTTTHPAA